MHELEGDDRINREGITFSQKIELARYSSFKPTFDSESTECRPLPDDKSIPGFGCIIQCRLDK